MNRQSGYYWIKFKNEWKIAFYSASSYCWVICCYTILYNDENFDEIDENIITRNLSELEKWHSSLSK